MWILVSCVVKLVNKTRRDALCLTRRAAAHPQGGAAGAALAAAWGHGPAGLLAVISPSEIFKAAGGNELPLACVHAATLLSS